MSRNPPINLKSTENLAVGVSRHANLDLLYLGQAHSDPLHQVTVISRIERRRRWSKEERLQILAEAFSPEDMCEYGVRIARRVGVEAGFSLAQAAKPMSFFVPFFTLYRAASAAANNSAGSRGPSGVAVLMPIETPIRTILPERSYGSEIPAIRRRA